MRRALFAGLLLLVLLAGGGVLLLQAENRAPLPSQDELRMDGFAVWPEDTVTEGMEACAEAEQWRLDPKETAFRFAREVLRYPEPSLNTDPIIDEESKAEVIRRLIDESLGGDDGIDARLRAIDATFGVVPDAPDWPEWLATVRGANADERLQRLGG
jgi:hypothetical protein